MQNPNHSTEPTIVSKMPLHSSFAVILSVLFVIFVLILVKKWRKPQKKLPPGPPKLPLIGNLLQLMSSLPPHHTITNLAKKYGPVMGLQLGEILAVVISSAEAAEEILKTKELGVAQRPQVLVVEIMSYDHPGIIYAPYGDHWRNMRKLFVHELLNTKRVQSFRSIREEEIWNFIEDVSMCEGVTINLSEKIVSVISNITSLAAFSRRCTDKGEFMSILDEALRVAGGFNLPDLYPSLKFLRYVTGLQPALEKMHKKMDKILDDIVMEHKLKPKDNTEREDVIDVLLRHQKSNQVEIPMTNTIIKGVTADILSAGSETTATTIEWAMAELVKNPRLMKKAQAEMRQTLNGKPKIEEKDVQNFEFLKCVVKETLRMHPPGALLPREATENIEISGYHIPAKAKILINAWAIGRDPSIWTEPDVFKPERFQFSSIDFRGGHFEFIPFGGGRRICPGISFAIASIELALAQLLYHFNWSVPGITKPEELDMSENFGITTRKKLNLRLAPTVHVPFTR